MGATFRRICHILRNRTFWLFSVLRAGSKFGTMSMNDMNVFPMEAGMIARAAKKEKTPLLREELKTRTREVLTREIGFISNPCFRELDADGCWREELAAARVDEPAAVESGGGRVAMPAHLEQMCSASLLTPQEEREFFCRMNYLKYRANSIRSTLNSRRPSVRKLDEIDALLSRANQLRNRIVTANTRLVVSIVKKFSDEMNPFDDLLSEGIACLLKAVEKFDFDRGFRFSTYATMAIRREVFRLIKRSHRDRTRFTSGTSEVLDRQVQADIPDGRTESALMQIHRNMSRLLSRLDEREQFILKARHGFIDIGMKPTFAKLGERLGISKERVRQLELRAMNKLRDLVDELRLVELGGLV
jgi:RNA polymerase primary sigma factor